MLSSNELQSDLNGTACYNELKKESIINNEILTTWMIYTSRSSMSTCKVGDYFASLVFKEMGLVQTVTLNFPDEGL